MCFKLIVVCALALRIFLSEGVSVRDKPVCVWQGGGSLCVLECM